MAGRRQPTALLEANGRKHLTEAEADARRDQEVYVAPPEAAVPPRWLPKKLHKEFREIGEILLASGLYSELDRDVAGTVFPGPGAVAPGRINWRPRPSAIRTRPWPKSGPAPRTPISARLASVRSPWGSLSQHGAGSWCPRPSRTPGRPARTMERMSSPRRCGPGRQRRWRGPYDRHGPGPVHPA